MVGRRAQTFQLHGAAKRERGGEVRVGKSVKNSTDTIFELEIVGQKTRAKIRINMQK